VLLLNNLGWPRPAAVRRFWPVLLILGGVLVIRGAVKRGGDSSLGPAA
jgi:hypothetical protein